MRWKKFGKRVGGNSLDFVIVKSTRYVCQLVLDGDTSLPRWPVSKEQSKSLKNVWPASKLAGCWPVASRRAKAQLWRVNSEDFHVGDLVIDIAGWDGDTLLWYCVHSFFCSSALCLLFGSSTASQHLLALRFAQPSPCFQCVCCEDVFLNAFIVVYSYRWWCSWGSIVHRTVYT